MATMPKSWVIRRDMFHRSPDWSVLMFPASSLLRNSPNADGHLPYKPLVKCAAIVLA